MNLYAMREAHPDLFLRNQTWFEGEAFMKRAAVGSLAIDRASFYRVVLADDAPQLYSAADLAMTYVQHPTHEIWARYLWTTDKDSLGQRVYVGGVTPKNGMKFEIHRHLRIDERWGALVVEWPSH